MTLRVDYPRIYKTPGTSLVIQPGEKHVVESPPHWLFPLIKSDSNITQLENKYLLFIPTIESVNSIYRKI